VDPESIALARAIGEQVLRDEHRCFVDEETDDSEHVPRIARIAESVRCALEQEGCDTADADLVKRDLLELPEQLLLDRQLVVLVLHVDEVQAAAVPVERLDPGDDAAATWSRPHASRPRRAASQNTWATRRLAPTPITIVPPRSCST
jgi:hypothetical protein